MRSMEEVRKKWGIEISEEMERALGKAGVQKPQDLVGFSEEELREKGLLAFKAAIKIILERLEDKRTSSDPQGSNGGPAWDVTKETHFNLGLIGIESWKELSRRGQEDPAAIRHILHGTAVWYLNKRLEQIGLPLILPRNLFPKVKR